MMAHKSDFEHCPYCRWKLSIHCCSKGRELLVERAKVRDAARALVGEINKPGMSLGMGIFEVIK